jgi:hypothetical protein
MRCIDHLLGALFAYGSGGLFALHQRCENRNFPVAVFLFESRFQSARDVSDFFV